MNRWLLVSLGILWVAEAALAQSDTGAPASNQALRSGKQLTLTAGVGLRTNQLFEGTFTGQYFLSPDSVVSLAATSLSASIMEQAKGKVDGNDLYFVGVTTEVKGSAVAVTYKHYITDSTYVEGGLDHATVKGEFRVSKDILGSGEDLTREIGSYKKLSALLQIGHQWQWENFTLGVSWIGLLVPLSTSKEFSDLDFLGEEPNSVEKFKTAADETQFTVLRFSIGWSF